LYVATNQISPHARSTRDITLLAERRFEEQLRAAHHMLPTLLVHAVQAAYSPYAVH